ncbi:GNAT family N-acetyltransferase [Chromobacterium sp. IIBBL 290-4]|uniref:GNAT family N-acetyltransferase n=1 Tax=Chromobacterium sp. IIBBL 290-4 TaxID=2953890 RepID=UPI0020B7EA47|nr:GNAT family N-acetyltransferase [Chromobacterium sp. IIBBL 290-4]UTH76479.1 GNAT family N-acetyltransferase [Chromobacterium sp. IIBBL 290-4]
MTYFIRSAEARDADALAGIYLDCRRAMDYAPLAHDDAAVRAWFAGALLPAGGVWLAEQGGEIAGFAACSELDGQFWLDQLYVAARHQGAGIGHALMQQVLAGRTQSCRLHVFQANAGARRFYEQHGFALLSLGDGQDNEERCPDVLYQWRPDGKE